MLEPGTVVGGKFRIVGLIDEGGMGVVYKAEADGKPRALKTALPGRESELRSRFVHERKATSRIDHRNVVDVIDVGEHEGNPFMVMPFYRGETLATRIAKRPEAFSLAELRDITIQVCDGVGAAHSQRVIHRDLKPANVFLETVGEHTIAVILDFGVALVEGQTISVSNRNSVLGTPYYMAPEQWAQPDAVDARTDIYALGCVLFEMATGRTPFAGGVDDLRKQHLASARPTASSLRPDLPRSFDELVQRMMAIDPNDRPQTMEAVKGEFPAGGNGLPIAKVLAIGGCGVAMLGLGLVLLSKDDDHDSRKVAGVDAARVDTRPIDAALSIDGEVHPPPPPPPATTRREELEELLGRWLLAQKDNVFGDYEALYETGTFLGVIRTPGNPPNEMGWPRWASLRQSMFGDPGMDVDVQPWLAINSTDSETFELAFIQSFSANGFSDYGEKSICVSAASGDLRIVREEMLASSTPPPVRLNVAQVRGGCSVSRSGGGWLPDDINADRALACSATVSPSGRWLMFVVRPSEHPDRPTIAFADLQTEKTSPGVTLNLGVHGISRAAWSPTESRVAVLVASDVYTTRTALWGWDAPGRMPVKADNRHVEVNARWSCGPTACDVLPPTFDDEDLISYPIVDGACGVRAKVSFYDLR